MKSELKITLLYVAIGILWIFLSDHLVLLFITKNVQEQITNFQNIKDAFLLFQPVCFYSRYSKDIIKPLDKKLKN